MNNQTKLILFIILWVTIASVGIYKASASNLLSQNTTKIIVGVNYFPPRIQQICSDNFIGVEYNPKLEKRCRILWTEWANEIKFASPY